MAMSHDGTSIRVIIAKEVSDMLIRGVMDRNCLDDVLNMACRSPLVVRLSHVRITHQVVGNVGPKFGPFSGALHIL
ncbi:hypothetical protein Hanom_Chr04g00341771 [Helianthus anomalus]